MLSCIMQVKTVVKEYKDSVEKIIRDLKRNNQVENLASTLKENRYFVSKATKKAVINATFRRARKHAKRLKK